MARAVRTILRAHRESGWLIWSAPSTALPYGLAVDGGASLLPVLAACQRLDFDAAAGPRAGDRQVGVHDEHPDQRRVPRVVASVHPWPEPVDVVVDDTGWRFLASVVEDDEHRELASPPDSVLGRLAEVAGAMLEGDGGTAGNLEFGDDVVVKKIIEAPRDRATAGQAASEFRIGAEQPLKV